MNTIQFLTDFKTFLDFVFLPLGLSNFGQGALFPFDEGQFNEQPSKLFRTVLSPPPS